MYPVEITGISWSIQGLSTAAAVRRVLKNNMSFFEDSGGILPHPGVYLICNEFRKKKDNG